MYYVINEPYLMHHGVKGQKWGIRRYQNPDGTLTNAGKARYFKTESKRLAKEYDSKKGGYTSRGNISRRQERSQYIEKHYNGNYSEDKSLYNKRAIGRNAAKGALLALSLVNLGVVISKKIKMENKIKTEQAINAYSYDQKYGEYGSYEEMEEPSYEIMIRR